MPLKEVCESPQLPFGHSTNFKCLMPMAKLSLKLKPSFLAPQLSHYSAVFGNPPAHLTYLVTLVVALKVRHEDANLQVTPKIQGNI